MASQAWRVVLDSNVFSARHFPTLAASRFLALARRRRVRPVFPAIVLEETVRAYRGAVTRALLLEQWIPYIASLQASFCNDLPSIWRRELTQGRGLKANEHMKSATQMNVLHALQTLAPDGSSPLVAEAVPQWLAGDARHRRRRELMKRVRVQASELADRKGLKPDVVEVPLSEVRREMALTLIKKSIAPGDRALETFHRWYSNPGDFPYFTQSIENELYRVKLAQRDHGARIDVNAQADLDVLTHLMRADVLVTNEASFMARAFDDIWKPRGKVRFTSTEFASFLEKL